MSAPGRPEDPRLEEALRRVRAVVEERRRSGDPTPPPQLLLPTEPVEPSDFFPWRKPVSGAPARTGPVAVNDLLELAPDRFVTRLFHALAGRDPSSAEQARWTTRVGRHAWARVVAVIAVRLSGPGRARGLPLRVRWGPLARLVAGAFASRARGRSGA